MKVTAVVAMSNCCCQCYKDHLCTVVCILFLLLFKNCCFCSFFLLSAIFFYPQIVTGFLAAFNHFLECKDRLELFCM